MCFDEFGVCLIEIFGEEVFIDMLSSCLGGWCVFDCCFEMVVLCLYLDEMFV